MNKNGNFAVVRRPSSAVEKAAPGAKRVLSGMVADALALAKKKLSPRIVVVNNEEGQIEHIKIIFRKCFNLDSTVLTFDDSEKAWQELLRADPDLLITDDNMLALGGMEIVSRLTDRKAAYPVILTSSFERPELLERVRDCASRGLKIKLLNKPFDVESFLKAVEESLSLKIPRNFATPDETKPIENLTKAHKRRGRLLVVDDEEGIRESMRVIFEDEYDLFIAEDGLTAIELAKQNDIDVAVLDIPMAVMSGLEVLERLKILKPDIEVITMSAFESDENIPESLRLGACDFISKPFDLATMRAAVSRAMQRRKRETARDPVTDALTMAHSEDAETIFKCGMNYYRGHGVPQDYTEAVKWFRIAAEQGYALAQYFLGICYSDGKGVPEDDVEAAKWCHQAAQNGNADAQHNISNCYFKGLGVPQDFVEAAKWDKKAAEQGHIAAQLTLGISYYLGEGVPQDYAESVKWYRKAAEQGNSNAEYRLGRCYDDGTGVPKNIVEAFKWYHKAAEQGFNAAQFMIGHCLMTGEGVTPDIAEGVKWYRKSAEQGFSPAQVNLAMCYRHGQGVPQNLTEAARWYRKAAEQGNAEAQLSLGDFYRRGEGVSQDYAEAVNWYRKAAAQGIAAAQNNLGVCYEKGLGVPKNQAEADKWFRKAAEQQSL